MATSPDNADSAGGEMRPEYDFRELRGVVRGKYRERLRTVRLAKDVAEAFPNEAAVNAALREHLRRLQSTKAPS
jgi:hypothetical protein